MNFKKYVKYIPFLIFLIILLCYHWKLAVVTADYPTFQTIVSKHPLLSLTKNGFLSYRYAIWSSRSLIEFNVGYWYLFLQKFGEYWIQLFLQLLLCY